jgi:hypothetical protein
MFLLQKSKMDKQCIRNQYLIKQIVTKKFQTLFFDRNTCNSVFSVFKYKIRLKVANENLSKVCLFTFKSLCAQEYDEKNKILF